MNDQTCATALDEEYKKPKHLADQLIRLLDDDDIQPPDRLRLLILYLLYKDGLLPADLNKLLAHAQLPPQDGQIISNLELLGARTTRGLKDPRPPLPPIFPRKTAPPPGMQEDLLISRYEPVLQQLLEAHANNLVDANAFPYTKPPLDLGADGLQPTLSTASSLRSGAKPTWARTRTNVSTENRQRVIVFVAGGATYAESRACYDVGKATGREVFLCTSHMLTPSLFVRQVADLSADRRRLGIPADQPKEKAPAHVLEPEPGERPPQQVQQGQGQGPPTQAMGNMNLNGARPQPQAAQQQQPSGGVRGTDGRPFVPPPQAAQAAQQQQQQQQRPVQVLGKSEPDKKEKKKRFGFGKS